MTLYELSQELLQLEDQLLVLEGETPDEAFEQHLDATHAQRDAKLEGYCGLIRNLEARAAQRVASAASFEQEARRLTALAESDQRAVQKLKERLKWFWERHGLGKVEAGSFRINLQANGGPLPVIIEDFVNPADVDERYHKVIPARVEWNKDNLRADLQAGKELEFARLGERGTRIVIK